MLPQVTNDLGITAASVGLVLTSMWGVMALVQYPGGRISDQLNRKTVLATSLGLMALGAGLFGVATTFVVFLSGGIVLGIGAGLFPPTADAYLSDTFVGRRGQAFGINSAAINFGGVLAAAVATVTLSVAVWRVAFLPVLLLISSVFVLLHAWNDRPHEFKGVDFDVLETVLRITNIPEVRWLIIASGLISFTWQGVTNFLPTYLQLEKGFTPFIASNLFALLFIVGMIANPIAGRAGDTIGYLRIAACSILAGSGGLALLLWGQSTPVIFVGIVALAMGLSAYWPVIGAFLMHRLDDESMGGDIGAIRTAYLGIGALGPAYVGAVSHKVGYVVAFSGLFACFVVALAVAAGLSYRS